VPDDSSSKSHSPAPDSSAAPNERDETTANQEDRHDALTGEHNRLGGRVKRYAKVSSGMGGFVVRAAGNRLFGKDIDKGREAADLAQVLGGLKGPLMKVAQLLATVPDAVPQEYAAELAHLQSDAPPMGWAFVRRRMKTELGLGWQKRFASFEHEPSAAASLGQVHKATLGDGSELACKLQYPDMASAVEADVKQLNLALSVHRSFQSAIDTREVAKEIADRVKEELDYEREARHMALYREIFDGQDEVRVPDLYTELSTKRLLSMEWLHGKPMLHYKESSQEERNLLTAAMFRAWWYPFAHFGIIHGDPHLGNYTVFEREDRPAGINLLDYGCIRIFPVSFVQGVVDLYHGLRLDDRDRIVHAYESWGFDNLSQELVDVLNIWARFIYGPLLEDRVRSIADGVSPAQYGRGQAMKVHTELKRLGPVTVPREFVFMDRAAIGLGGVFLHLRAEMNFYQLFNEQIEDFSQEKLKEARTSLRHSAWLADY
jgi:predicted unusual protein kinase regulating ubiquinone biosynthesis (AarF/ABC1/UbiB family)